MKISRSGRLGVAVALVVASLLGASLLLVDARGFDFPVVNQQETHLNAQVSTPQVETPACLVVPTRAQDPDVASMIQLGKSALARAELMAGPVRLRQVDVDWKSRRHHFYYTDAGLSREISLAGVPGAAEGELSPGFSPGGQLLSGGTPAFSLEIVRVSPNSVAEAMQQQYPGVDVLSMTLFVEGCDLVWYVFGDVPGGTIAARVSNSSSTLTPLQSQPIRKPAVAPR